MWETVKSISTPLALGAFVAACVVTIVRILAANRLKLIQSATAANKELVEKELEKFSVDTAGLTKEQKYDLLVKQLTERRLRLTTYLVALGAVAALCLAAYLVALALGKPNPPGGAASSATNGPSSASSPTPRKLTNCSKDTVLTLTANIGPPTTISAASDNASLTSGVDYDLAIGTNTKQRIPGGDPLWAWAAVGDEVPLLALTSGTSRNPTFNLGKEAKVTLSVIKSCVPAAIRLGGGVVNLNNEGIETLFRADVAGLNPKLPNKFTIDDVEYEGWADATSIWLPGDPSDGKPRIWGDIGTTKAGHLCRNSKNLLAWSKWHDEPPPPGTMGDTKHIEVCPT
jgi:hypothetical protein